MSDLHAWLKALHIIAVIAWMAGMLYLPRLYVYHAEALKRGLAPDAEPARSLAVMERRLLRLIINPAMAAAWLLGLTLAWHGGLWGEGWLHAKLALLLLMQILHGLFSRWRRDLAAGHDRHGPRFYRIVNELPTLLIVGIVILAVVKPF